MDEAPKRLVLEILTRAHEAAFAVLEPYLASVSEAQQREVLATLEEVRACVQGQAQGQPAPVDLVAHLKALISKQQDPQCRQLLKQYADNLNYFLAYALKRLLGPPEPEDNDPRWA